MKRIVKGFLIFLCVMILAAAAALATNHEINKNVYLTEYEYTNENLPEAFDGYRIAVISDIHNSVYADKFIELLNEENADMLLFAGDMIQKPDADLENVVKIIKSQSENIPVYAIFGNHEASNGYQVRQQIAKELKDAGAKVLLNGRDDLIKDGQRIRVIGIEDISDDIISDEDIERMRQNAVNNVNCNMVNILFFHRADLYPKLNDLPVDLILSGHLHGGIVRIPFVGGVIGKRDEFFPKYTSGVYKEMNTTMIVSRGCDHNTKKTRVFNPPEVLMVTLRKN